MAVEAFFIAEAFQWLSTVAVLFSFWLFYFVCLPPRGVSYPFVIDWSADVSAASSLGFNLQDGLQAVACKDVPMQPVPAHVSALDVHLRSEMNSCEAPGLYKFQLLDANSSEVFAGVWQPLLPVTRWAPLVVLGLAEQHVAPLLKQPLELSEETGLSISSTRICLAPPLRSLDISLQVDYKLRGFYRFVQRWPLVWSAVLVCATGFATWSVVCLLLVFLVSRQRTRAAAAEGEAQTPSMSPVREEVEDRIAVARAAVSDVWKQSISKIEEAGTQVVQAAKDPDLQVTAASAVSGALALGAGGGCAGLVTGSVAGGACGLVPAIFTFGLSIPVGAVLGGSAGAAAGTALGSGAGALVGTLLGRRWVQNRPVSLDAAKVL